MNKMTYIKLFADYLDAIEPLEDAGRGRLFTALLTYARTGEVPRLTGYERFLFPMMRAQVDRDAEELAEKEERISRVRREAGRLGGLARAGKRGKGGQGPAKPPKDEGGDKEEGEARTGGDEDLSRVMREYMERIEPTPSPTSMSQLTRYVRTLGPEVCLRAIYRAVDAGVRKWTYVAKVLQNCQRDGVNCLADWDRREEQNGRKRDAERQAAGSAAASSPYDLEALEL